MKRVVQDIEEYVDKVRLLTNRKTAHQSILKRETHSYPLFFHSFFFENQSQVQKRVALNETCIHDKLSNIRGAVMIAYPMGLPEWDLVKVGLDSLDSLKVSYNAIDSVRRFVSL